MLRVCATRSSRHDAPIPTITASGARGRCRGERARVGTLDRTRSERRERSLTSRCGGGAVTVLRAPQIAPGGVVVGVSAVVVEHEVVEGREGAMVLSG
jgi:hypothetical protein